MLLRVIDAAEVVRDPQLGNFLSHTDDSQATKLSPCQDKELNILDYVGGGKEGLVFRCSIPRSDESIALKLVCDEEIFCRS
jgi:hypothetical protein